jgi:hypothetical protein
MRPVMEDAIDRRSTIMSDAHFHPQHAAFQCFRADVSNRLTGCWLFVDAASKLKEAIGPDGSTDRHEECLPCISQAPALPSEHPRAPALAEDRPVLA